MRRIWLVATLFLGGCASLLQHAHAGYPDADLPRFAVAAPGMKEAFQDVGSDGTRIGTSTAEMLAVTTGADGVAHHRFRMRMVWHGGSKVEEREERVYPDRIELETDEPYPFVPLRTPLRPGTRWRYERDEPGLYGIREIVAVEDVCTPAGAFKGALVVEARWTLRRAADHQLATYRSREWFAPDLGLVRRRMWREDQPAYTITSELEDVQPGPGQAPFAFPPCS